MSTSCIVLVPYLTHVEAACERGLRELERRGIEVRRYPSTAAVDRTRCDAATAALAEGFDELMWIDSDIVFEPDDVSRLRCHDLPLVAGIYAKKGVQALAFEPTADTRELHVGDAVDAGLHDVAYVGAGFLLTRRAVYADIQRVFSLPTCNAHSPTPSVPYFLPMVIAADNGDYRYLGEDYAFCERARQAGHQVVVDTAIRLGHVGAYTYGWEDAGQSIARVTSAKFTFAPTKRRS